MDTLYFDKNDKNLIKRTKIRLSLSYFLHLVAYLSNFLVENGHPRIEFWLKACYTSHHKSPYMTGVPFHMP